MLNFTRFLFPARCILCDRALKLSESVMCAECKTSFKPIGDPACFRCGRPVSAGEELCCECVNEKHEFEGGRFVFPYGATAGSLYRFKYSGRKCYGAGYAGVTVDRLSSWLEAVGADALVPVPIHKNRLIKRGYNQAEIFAREVGKLTGIPVKADCVARVADTRPQKLFDKRDRRHNVKNAFIVRENVVKLGTVIVVDDIFTTGSTIDSLAKALKAAGVGRIYFLTVSAAGT